MRNRHSTYFIGIASLLFLLSAGTAFASGVASGASLITKNGPIKGVLENGVYAYKNIPYAKAPIGELRFAPPQDVESWKEVRDCTQYGPIMTQWLTSPFIVTDTLEQSEEALTLNVWTPSAPRTNDKLPVYVYIHGGGYGMGSGNDKIVGGTSFAQNGVVTVTINYRLSTLGFFASNETYKRYGTTGNWGLLDQIKALEWVRDNIAEFGGDPSRVTIGGESAGSFSVSALLLSPLAEGLFSNAIMESGTLLGLKSFLPSRGDFQKSIEETQKLADLFGVTDTAEGLAYLRSVNGDVLNYLSAFRSNQAAPQTALFLGPVFDGTVLPVDPVAALLAGNYNKANVLIGFNQAEGAIFVASPVDADFYAAYGPRLAGEAWPLVAERFPIDEDNSATQRMRQILAYAWFSAGEKVFADVLAPDNRVFMYNFNYVASEDAVAGVMGAYHTAEIPHAFNTLALKNLTSAESKGVSQEIHTRWINFIKNGDPNVGIATPSGTQWPQYDPVKQEVILFDKETTAGPLPDKENIDFVTRVLYGVGE